jgi:hypothetical protein
MVAYDPVQYNTVMSLMRDRFQPILTIFFPLAMVVVVAQTVLSCAAQPTPVGQAKAAAASSESAREVTGDRRAAARGITFRPEAATLPASPSGIGSVSSDLAARLSPRAGLSIEASFKDAYLDAVFRGDALEGVLGGDRVHGWPSTRPAAYAQNWRSSTPEPNSWGLNALVLAVHPLEGDRAFVVRGAVLDFYGQGKGVGSANGIAGYGAPLSDEFPYAGGVAQRFELGLIAIASDGSATFLAEKPGSLSASPGESVGSLTAASSDGLSAESVAAAFRSSWTAAVDRGLPHAEADGPVQSVSLPAIAEQGSDPGSEGPKESVRVVSALVQTYGDSAWALVLPVGKGLGTRARLLAPPFLDRVLSEGSWEAAFAAYGVPLSDPFPWGGRIAQRFSAGWMETE